MPKFYFDFQDDDGGGGETDDVGAVLPTVDHARKEAVAAIGDAVRDFSRSYCEGCLRILVRDTDGPVLEVSATLETRAIR
jgi:hypothetical protein